MYVPSFITAIVALTGAVSAAPRQLRTRTSTASDGFPNPSAQQLLEIERLADGQLSNAPPPAKLAPSSLTAFQLIAFNENFEVAFFSSLIDNITNSQEGKWLRATGHRERLIEIFTTIKAQEELHALNAEGVLKHFNAFAPPPCTYKFPTTDIMSAIRLAETFTSVVLGTLQDASQLFATNGDVGPVRAVASVIGQEGEQNGWFRHTLGLKPSQKPFLTTSTAAFAFSALQGFIESCPFDIAKSIDIPIFPPLSVISGNGGADVSANDQQLQFTADLTNAKGADKFIGGNGAGLFVTYLTGQNLPVSEPVSGVTWKGKVATFTAVFPFTANVMEGLSIAALTTSNNFTNADALPAATLAAPGLIQVNDKF